jgi:heme-degrading monooxygenase HmoA
MVARVTTSQRSQADEAKLFIEEYAIPSLKKVPGFRGAFFLADREKGTGISITLWEDAAAAEASDHASTARRGLAARMTGAIFESVDTYEVIAQADPALTPA